MTNLAIVFMSSSLLLVIALTVWCYFKVLAKPGGKSSTDSPDSRTAD